MVSPLAQAVIALFASVAGAGVLFEAGRRLGRGSAERESTQGDVEQLENKLDEKFSKLDERLNRHEALREREHTVTLQWLESITKGLDSEGFDVGRPDEVRPAIDTRLDDDRDLSDD